jgi:hypothetical protein
MKHAKLNEHDRIPNIEPVRMDQVQGQWKAGSDYTVVVPPGDFLTLRMGVDIDHPLFSKDLPNQLGKALELFGFKHYQPHKHWTHRPGVNFYFRIPKSSIKLLPYKGYSYPYIQIGDLVLTLNTSGGSGTGNGWYDYISEVATTAVNHPVANLKYIASHAVPGELPDNLKKPITDEYRCAVASRRVPAAIITLIEAKKQPIIKLADGYSFSNTTEGFAAGLIRNTRTTWRKPTAEEIASNPRVTSIGNTSESGRLKHFVVTLSGVAVRVKPSQVDWFKTATANHFDFWGNMVAA